MASKKMNGLDQKETKKREKKKRIKMENENNVTCENLPAFLSSFVDTFVDFTVTDGLFLPNPLPQNALEMPPPMAAHYPSPDRLVAIGDLHGDLEKSRRAFRLAGLIDGADRWTGGSTTVVQVGDVLDRGGEEIKILYLLEKLKREAEKNGGKVLTLNGNHEIMNVELDFRYATKTGLKEFENWGFWYGAGNKMKSLCVGLKKPRDLFDGVPLVFKGVDEKYWNGIRCRIAALRPSGPIAGRFLSKNVTVLVVGESVFVHGGLLKEHVEYGLQKINEEVRDWINGLSGRHAPGYCTGRDAVVWLRKFSDDSVKCDCSLLEHVLATIPGAKRMIMGHTIQDFGINDVCDGRAIRIDVGMSKGCGNGLPEVLEILGDKELQVLPLNPLYQNKNKIYMDAYSSRGLALPKPGQGLTEVEVKV
ncbi:shewanella-like protein phosphatase 2 [Mangifera indica]|uniref:shewanella-like protein phosphatase 2 n=1 Tax=Mangifera indica TaxID=29780 RepID=UPI001CFBF156|nr:shewanella-like protein phosphatase 2 [Mangifera indica]